MGQRIRNLYQQYMAAKQEIEGQQLDKETKESTISRIELVLKNQLVQKDFTDEEKIEILKLLIPWREDYIAKIIETFKDDDLKIQAIQQFELKDEYLILAILETFKNDEKKVEALKLLTREGIKAQVIVTLKDEEIIKRVLEDNPDARTAVIKHLRHGLQQLGHRKSKEMWNFMRLAQLEYQVIPYILYDSKFKIIESRYFDEGMKQDIERYLGKTLPEDINQIPLLERIGIDRQAIQGNVITSKEQIGLTELQKRYLSNVRLEGRISGKDSERRKIAIRDFEGTINPNVKDASKPITTWEELLLGLQRTQENIARHSEEFLFESEENGRGELLSLIGANGKYYVAGNGNHRMTLLKAKYLTEMMRANGDENRIKAIEEQYMVKASEVREIPTNINELIGIQIIIRCSNRRNIRKWTKSGI